MKKIKSHYDNLQVQETASIDVIKGAYKHLIQKWHPDKHPKDRAKAERITKLLNDAFYVLSDPIKRKAHDEWITSQRKQEKHKYENTEPADDLNDKNNYQTDGQKNDEEYVSSNVNASSIKPANKQYVALFFSTAVGIAFVYTLLYGLNSAGAFIQVSKNNIEMLLIGFGITTGVAILPLFIMKFWNNKAGWISMMFCVFFYYHGVKSDAHKNTKLVDSKDNAQLAINDADAAQKL